MNAVVDLRPATAADLGGVVALLDDVGLPITGLGAARIFVAAAGEEIAGVVAVETHGDVALLRSLAVSPNARGQGVGAALVDHVRSTAAADGVARLYALSAADSTYLETVGFSRLAREDLPPALAGSPAMMGDEQGATAWVAVLE